MGHGTLTRIHGLLGPCLERGRSQTPAAGLEAPRAQGEDDSRPLETPFFPSLGLPLPLFFCAMGGRIAFMVIMRK